MDSQGRERYDYSSYGCFGVRKWGSLKLPQEQEVYLQDPHAGKLKTKNKKLKNKDSGKGRNRGHSGTISHFYLIPFVSLFLPLYTDKLFPFTHVIVSSWKAGMALSSYWDLLSGATARTKQALNKYLWAGQCVNILNQSVGK